jgi:hypothetical protein
MPAPTAATFHLPHSSAEPLELSVKMPSLAMAVVHRDATSKLDERWAKAIGVYVLLGSSDDADYEYRAYAGQSGTGGLKERLTTHRNSPTWQKSHHLPKEWWKRALIVRSRDEDGFNSAEAGWLEGRLWDILDSAPAAKLVGKKGDDQTLPKHDRERLEQYLPTITAVLRAIGASPDTPDQAPPEKPRKKHNAEIIDLINAELLPTDARLRSISSQHEAIAIVKADGQLEVAGVSYDSPSGAAVAVAGSAVNGWNFWGFQSGGGRLVPLADLRAQLEPGGGGASDEIQAKPKNPKPRPPKQKARTGQAALKPLLDSGLLTPGAKVFAAFKGQRYEATVDEEGLLHLADGSKYRKPSGAAVAITGYETNGWRFWRVASGDKTILLADLREQAKTST